MISNNNFNVLCASNHQARSICVDKRCQKPAFICLNEQCSCNTNHDLCISIKIQKLNLIFNELGNKDNRFLQITIDYCEKMIKKLVIIRQQMSYQLNGNNFIFHGDQGKLYQSLKEGRSKNITQKLVLSVIQNIRNKQNIVDYEVKLKTHQQVLKNILIQIQKIIKKVSQLHQHKKIPLKFSQTLHHDNIKIVNDNIIKLSGNSLVYKVQNDQSKFCLMEPSIESRSDKKQTFRFKVINTKDKVLAFGLCHRETAIKNRFGWVSYIGGGYYYVRAYDGNSVSHAYQNQNKTQTNIKSIDKGQIIQIIFDQKQKIFTVTNVSKNQSAVLKVNIQIENPLHIVILLYDKGDQIEYLGEVSQN